MCITYSNQPFYLLQFKGVGYRQVMDLNKLTSKKGFGHYSPEDVTIVIATVNAYGFPDRDFVSIVRDSPIYETTTTVDGGHHRLKISDDKHTMTLTLSSLSDFNSFLSKVYQLGEVTDKILFPIIVKDGLGNSLFASNTAWIEEVPETTYSEVETDKVWVFKCTGCSYTVGGNSDRASTGKNLFNYLVGQL